MKYVYLHGFASSPASAKATFFRERFAEAGLDLSVPDLARGDFEHLTITRQLGEIERAAGAGPAVLIGSSMGGYLAALYAARHGEIARVLLMAPAFGFARRWPETLGPAKIEEWRRSGWLETWHYGENRPARIGYSLIEDGAKYEDYPDVEQPALVFHGSGDVVVPSRFSEEFARRHPAARLRILDSDHELRDVIGRIWDESRDFLFPAED